MILDCHGLTKAFGEQTIVTDGSFHIEDHEKAALIGANGAGKTTILKMIAHELEPDAGFVTLAKGKSLGYLPQYQNLTGGSTIYEEVKSARADVLALEERLRELEREMPLLSEPELSSRMETYNRLMAQFENANGYAVESEIAGVLKGLGFTEDEFDLPVGTLSGGQKTRVALGKLLLQEPDLLLLDEPTNHLDLKAISWLETYLANYPGAVLVVSHDRYFLDRVVTKILEIEKGTLTSYSGNYSDYAAKKQQIRDAQLNAWMKQEREIRHQEEVIDKLRSFNREKSIRRAESREKKLEKMTPAEKPAGEEDAIRLTLEPSEESGNDVLTVEHLGKSFPTQVLFTDVNFELKRGEHVAIIGDNGTGKSTLLKILNEVLSPDSGSFRLGTNVTIGYFDQEQETLDPDKTIFDEISDAFPKLSGTRIRNMLAAFLFTGDDVFKQIRSLSGGERSRVSLAKLMLSKANFLILDEPTNHLDISSREILETALNRYTGTVLYVSHDRYFINRTAGRILELVNQTFVNYIGNYDYYLEKKEELTAAYAPASPAASRAKTEKTRSRLNWEEQKEEQARQRKRQNDLKKTEEKITDLESQSQEIDRQMTLEEVYTDPEKCRELTEEKSRIRQELETLYDTWEDLLGSEES